MMCVWIQAHLSLNGTHVEVNEQLSKSWLFPSTLLLGWLLSFSSLCAPIQLGYEWPTTSPVFIPFSVGLWDYRYAPPYPQPFSCFLGVQLKLSGFRDPTLHPPVLTQWLM